MLNLKPRIEEKLDENTIQKIAAAPKPTPVAEAIAVTKQFEHISLDLEEIAEILNIAEPGKNKRAKASDFDVQEMRKHPNLRVIQSAGRVYIKYIPDRF